MAHWEITPQIHFAANAVLIYSELLVEVKNIIPITRAPRQRACKLASGPSQNSLRSNIDSAYPTLR